MLSILEILSIIFIHWVADFLFQTDKQAKGKSKNWGDLLSHTMNYTLIFGIIAYWIVFIYVAITNNILLININILWFLPITFICHTITDYFTSRLNLKLAPKATVLKFNSDVYGSNEMISYSKNASWRKFFNSIGFDQLLHYTQLFLTYYFLTK